jgi:uncharacterized membrane protein YhaH (DUF805 family)
LSISTEVGSGQGPSWWREVLYYALVHPAGVVCAVIAAILVTGVIQAVLLRFGASELFVDRLQSSILLSTPFYPLEVLFGFSIGFIANRRLHSRSAPLIWILGVLLVWIDIPSVTHNGTLGEFIWGRGWAERSEQLVTIAPFDAAVGYSIGAWLTGRRQLQTHPSETGTKS